MAHVSEDFEITIAKGVVQKHAIALRECGRSADNMDDRNIFGVGSSDSV